MQPCKGSLYIIFTELLTTYIAYNLIDKLIDQISSFNGDFRI